MKVRRVSYSGSTAVFQTVDGGSIPPTRSKQEILGQSPQLT